MKKISNSRDVPSESYVRFSTSVGFFRVCLILKSHRKTSLAKMQSGRGTGLNRVRYDVVVFFLWYILNPRPPPPPPPHTHTHAFLAVYNMKGSLQPIACIVIKCR